MSNNLTLCNELGKYKCQCNDRSHSACEGTDTKNSELYTTSMVQLIHKQISSRVRDIQCLQPSPNGPHPDTAIPTLCAMASTPQSLSTGAAEASMGGRSSTDAHMVADAASTAINNVVTPNATNDNAETVAAGWSSTNAGASVDATSVSNQLYHQALLQAIRVHDPDQGEP